MSLHAISDDKHRGDAYLGFLGTRLIDIATGDPFDAELPPRIASIAPKTGSLGGGTDMTIYGTGFGADTEKLDIEVGGVPCDVTAITTSSVRCRLHPNPSGAPPARPTPTADPIFGDSSSSSALGSYAGERGVRWQWSSSSKGAAGSLLLPSFEVPTSCSSNCASGWAEHAANGTIQIVEGWFELPNRACII